MSTVTRIRIKCDARNQDCPEGVDTTSDRESEARADLDEAGWEFHRRGDLCPEHAVWADL